MLNDLQRYYARLREYFPEREIYVRSNGRVRFLKITTPFQLKTLGALSAAFVVWLAVSGTLVVSQAETAARQAAISARARVVAATETRVDAYRAAIDGKADTLEARQHFLDTLAAQYFGEEPGTSRPPKSDDRQSPAMASPTGSTAVGAHLVPGALRLDAVEQAQFAFAERVAANAESRARRAAATVRRLGLNPDRLVGAPQGVGGPFVAFGGGGSQNALGDRRFTRLSAALDRLDRLERAVLSVPSFRPAPSGSLSSRFGFRFDPFTRWPALHQGQDFSGPRGAPIFAAAPGKVVRAGWWSGYGKAVEIDHGRGLRTRYGHLSGIDVHPGDRITRGTPIGRMGSTGRSTGTHLHFEVRLDGRAVNPRPFLEASADVLKIQGSIRKRIGGLRHGR